MRLRTAPVELKICPVCSVQVPRSVFGLAMEIADWNEVAPGAHVVHTLYGIGVFRGTRMVQSDGLERLALAIEYADGAMVYVTDDWSGRVRRCAGLDNPELASLGVAHKGVVEYEGASCLHCHMPFQEDRVRKTYDDRLILIGSKLPTYALHEVFKCPQCANIFEITEEKLRQKNRCRKCGRELMNKKEIKAVLSGKKTRREKAAAITKALAGYIECRECYPGGAAHRVCWCPICDCEDDTRTSSCLPRQPTKVWRRTSFVIESIDELPEHRQPSADDPALDEILNSTYGGDMKLGSAQ